MKHSDPRKAPGQGAYSRSHVVLTEVKFGKASTPSRAVTVRERATGGIGLYSASRARFDQQKASSKIPNAPPAPVTAGNELRQDSSAALRQDGGRQLRE